MTNAKWHSSDISNYKFLITGGCGFIGSNIVEYLIKNGAGFVRVLDNLSTGKFENIKEHLGKNNFDFVFGDIRDIDVCNQSLIDIDYVSHQAALGSVPRSIVDPLTTNDVNINGFLNVIHSVKESNRIKRMVYAASSSTYGSSEILPKIEGNEGQPLSPYAVTKAVNEMYADVYSRVYNLTTIGLRYFNVFGPKQSFENAYAAVLPIFCRCFLLDEVPVINGDGLTSRDFTFVENAVQANIKALFAESITKHEVYNVACEEQINLNQVISRLQEISGKGTLKPIYKEERIGDIKHSKASISKIKKELGYNPTIPFDKGIELAYQWYSKNLGKM